MKELCNIGGRSYDVIDILFYQILVCIHHLELGNLDVDITWQWGCCNLFYL